MPDTNIENNVLNMSKTNWLDKINLKEYEGTYSSEKFNADLVLKEVNNSLSLSFNGDNLTLNYNGDNTFIFDENESEIEIVFAKDKKSFVVKENGQNTEFKRK